MALLYDVPGNVRALEAVLAGTDEQRLRTARL
jgi:hypothetical protein